MTTDSLVTVGLRNSVEFFLACAGIWKAGGIPSPVSPLLPSAEPDAVIDLSPPSWSGSRPSTVRGYRPVGAGAPVALIWRHLTFQDPLACRDAVKLATLAGCNTLATSCWSGVGTLRS